VDAPHLGHIAAHASTMTMTSVIAGARVSFTRPSVRRADRRRASAPDHHRRNNASNIASKPTGGRARLSLRTRGAVETAVAEPETSTSSETEETVDQVVDEFVTVSAGDGTVLRRPKDPRAKREKKRDKRSEQQSLDQLDMEQNFCVLKRRYDPEAIKKEALEQPVALARRGAVVVTKFATLFARKESLLKLDAEDGGTRYAAELKNTLTSLGPLFVKLGQNLANRPDLVEEEVMEELTKLQDRVPPFPDSIAKQMILDQIGGSLEETFSEFNEVAVAAASLGQVYKGRLRSKGRRSP